MLYESHSVMPIWCQHTILDKNNNITQPAGAETVILIPREFAPLIVTDASMGLQYPLKPMIDHIKYSKYNAHEF